MHGTFKSHPHQNCGQLRAPSWRHYHRGPETAQNQPGDQVLGQQGEAPVTGILAATQAMPGASSLVAGRGPQPRRSTGAQSPSCAKIAGCRPKGSVARGAPRPPSLCGPPWQSCGQLTARWQGPDLPSHPPGQSPPSGQITVRQREPPTTVGLPGLRAPLGGKITGCKSSSPVVRGGGSHRQFSRRPKPVLWPIQRLLQASLASKPAHLRHPLESQQWVWATD